MTLSGLFLYNFIDPANPPIWLIGVPAAAVSLVFKAFYGFGMKLDKLGIALSMISCAVAVMINGDEHIPRNSSQFVYPLLLVCGGMCTMVDFLRGPDKAMGEYTRSASGVRVKSVCTFADGTCKRSITLTMFIFAGIRSHAPTKDWNAPLGRSHDPSFLALSICW